MEFRKIREEDIPLYLKMAADFYRSPAVLHDIPAEHLQKTAELCVNGTPFADLFLFWEEEKPLGYGLLAYSHSQEAGGTVVWIEEIYLNPEARGRGAGSAFLAYVKETIPARRYRLEVEPENHRVLHLYRRSGFSPLGYVSYVLDQ